MFSSCFEQFFAIHLTTCRGGRILAYYMLKPLILRANAGEWIEVTLHNLFDPKNPVPYFDYPSVPSDMKHKPSMRVSINPQYLHYDPVCDSGINVGYNNHEQTVGVGESKKYLWYADQDGELVKTATDDGEEVDDEDTGEKGYNYHSERFANRLIKDHRVSKVFSSRVHGDPATPVFTAYPYERVIFRVLRNNFGHKRKNTCRKLFERICK